MLKIEDERSAFKTDDHLLELADAGFGQSQMEPGISCRLTEIDADLYWKLKGVRPAAHDAELNDWRDGG